MTRIIDCSLALEPGIRPFPASRHPAFQASVVATIPEHGREIRSFSMGSHTATHIDAMRHFVPDGATIDQIPLDTLVGPGMLVHLDGVGPGDQIGSADLRSRLVPGPLERLVIRTDWSKRWKSDQYYDSWPSLTRECIEWIIGRGVRLIGIDFPSPDPAYFGADCSEDCPNHKLLFAHGIVLVEYLAHLDQLPAGLIYLMVLPLKLVGFDGAPARVAAYPIEV